MLNPPDTLWFYYQAFSLKPLFLNCFSSEQPPHTAGTISLNNVN